jgi:hypothetical protein
MSSKEKSFVKKRNVTSKVFVAILKKPDGMRFAAYVKGGNQMTEGGKFQPDS